MASLNNAKIVKKSILQNALGFFLIDKYEYGSIEAKNQHDLLYDCMDKSDLPNPRNLLMETTKAQITGCEEGIVLMSLKRHDSNRNFMPCYGVLNLECSQNKGTFVPTPFGIVVDGNMRSGLWRFLQPSCSPNLRVVTTWDTSTNSLFMFFKTTRQINIGDILSCHHNEIIRTQNGKKYKCVCDTVVKKSKKIQTPKKYRCKLKSCGKYGHLFYDKSGLTRHKLTHSKVKIPCGIGTCKRNFRRMDHKKRHIQECHSNQSTPRFQCKYCKRTYSRKRTLLHHLLKSKRGCRAFNEKMLKLCNETNEE